MKNSRRFLLTVLAIAIIAVAVSLTAQWPPSLYPPRATPTPIPTATPTPEPTATPTPELTATPTPAPAAAAGTQAVPTPLPTNDKGMPYLLGDIEGSPMTFSDLKGKVVYLNFFTSWCPPCQQEMPDILKLQEAYGEELQVVLIHVPDRDTQEAARKFLKDNGLDSLRMVEDANFLLTTFYQLEGYPLSVFIDRDGYLSTYQPGGMTYELMEEAVQMAGLKAPNTP